MKAKIYVLSTVLADENGPAMPAVSTDESEARAKYDEVMRWEWDSMMDPDTDGPYGATPPSASGGEYGLDEKSRNVGLPGIGFSENAPRREMP